MSQNTETLEDLREPDHYGRIPESLIYDKNAPHTAIRLYGVLDRHLNKKTKACYPGYRRIKSLTGMGMTTISKALEYLKNQGYLRVLVGDHKTNHYQMMDLKRMAGAPETGAPLTLLKQERKPLLKREHNQSYITTAFNHSEPMNGEVKKINAQITDLENTLHTKNLSDAHRAEVKGQIRLLYRRLEA